MNRLLLQTPRLHLIARATSLSGRRPSSSFTSGPSPPKLPPAQQAEFERLQRKASLSSAFQQPDPAKTTQAETAARKQKNDDDDAAVYAGVFRGAPPEFEGDKNPRTGEVGGPKNEPLRWGDRGDWSYNGRVTDF